MPVLNRKRRAQEEPSDSPPPARRRPSTPASEASSVDEEHDDDAGDGYGTTQTQTSQEQMVKKLVRLALASEYSRRPIKREDISKKVLAPHTGRRQFYQIFNSANDHLVHVFGMTLTELPAREKVTAAQKRAAQRLAGNKAPSHNTQANGDTAQSNQDKAVGNPNSAPTTSKQYILTSTLPPRYRIPAILPPAQIPSASAEGGYIGLTTFVLSLIYLSPGHTLSESRLEKHLRTMNAGDFVLGEKTEKGALARMQREGYIVKVRERGEGEDTVDFHIGPRGKVEVGERGVAGLVREVYGDGDGDEVERRLVRSLGDVVIEKKVVRRRSEEGKDEGEGEGGEGDQGVSVVRRNRGGGDGGSEPAQARRSSGRDRRRREEEEEEEEEEDDGEEEEEEEDEEEDEEEEG